MVILTKIVKSILALVLVGIFFYVFLNWPTIAKLVKQKRAPGVAADRTTQDLVEQIAELPVNLTSAATTVSSANTAATKNTAKSVQDIKSNFKNDWLYYPRLGIKAPVDWYVEMPNINKVLAESLVHVNETASPEEGGDVVIAGHSSYYWWSNGAYKNIFAPLINAQQGDDILIKKNDTLYLYRVKTTTEISGDDGFKTYQGSQLPKTLDLLTCVPVGTNLRRLIIKSDLFQAI